MAENAGWKERKNPLRLERRYEFASYEKLREFLDKAADLSRETGLYPNIGFGKTYASFVIYADDDNHDIGSMQWAFARKLDELIEHEPESR